MAEFQGLNVKDYKGDSSSGFPLTCLSLSGDTNSLVDIYSACDDVGVQSSYDRYINYKRSINVKEAVAGFFWATMICERPRLTKLKSSR